MSSPYHSLAARFRTAVRQQHAKQDRSAAQEQARIEAAHRAREDLLNALEDFAEEADFFEISRSGQGITLKYDGRRLRFESERRTPIILVRSAHLRHRTQLEYHPTRRCWQVVTQQKQRRASVDLFPQGLERLISMCFDIRPAGTRQEKAREPTRERQPVQTEAAHRFWR